MPLFDTTVFIDYYRGDRDAQMLMDAALQGALEASCSALTSFEIWIGISSDEEELDYIAIMDFLEEVPLTAAMSKMAATWLRNLPLGRSESLFRDALIAATAAQRGETVYTRNVRDFTRFYSNVETY